MQSGNEFVLVCVKISGNVHILKGEMSDFGWKFNAFQNTKQATVIRWADSHNIKFNTLYDKANGKIQSKGAFDKSCRQVCFRLLNLLQKKEDLKVYIQTDGSVSIIQDDHLQFCNEL